MLSYERDAPVVEGEGHFEHEVGAALAVAGQAAFVKREVCVAAD